MPLVYSIVGQGTFIWVLNHSVHHFNDDDDWGGSTCKKKTPYFLSLFCIFVLLSVGLGTAIMMALQMSRWISCFPDWDQEKHKRVMEDVKERDGASTFLCFQEATDSHGQCLSLIHI